MSVVIVEDDVIEAACMRQTSVSNNTDDLDISFWQNKESVTIFLEYGLYFCNSGAGHEWNHSNTAFSGRGRLLHVKRIKLRRPTRPKAHNVVYPSYYSQMPSKHQHGIPLPLHH
jgi:hypothetical protein